MNGLKSSVKGTEGEIISELATRTKEMTQSEQTENRKLVN